MFKLFTANFNVKNFINSHYILTQSMNYYFNVREKETSLVIENSYFIFILHLNCIFVCTVCWYRKNINYKLNCNQMCVYII